MKKLMKHLPSLCWILVGNLMYAFVVALFVLVVSLVFSAVLHNQLAYSYYYMR